MGRSKSDHTENYGRRKDVYGEKLNSAIENSHKEFRLRLEIKKLQNLLHEQKRKQPSDILLDLRKFQNCSNNRNEISDLKADVKTLQDRCTYQDELLHNSQTEIDRLKAEIDMYLKDIEQLRKNEKHLETKLKKLEEKIRKQPSDILLDLRICQNCSNNSNEISDLKADVKTLQDRCTYQDELLHNSQTEIDRLKAEIDMYLKDTEQLRKNENLETKVKKMEETMSQDSSEDLSDTKSCQNCWKYSNDISDLKTEINRLRDRLSEAAGNKLRDNNPNIADLSDMNRPTSLAEKFSSLYTDEYTDAMEVIEEIMDEQASALFMLQLLKSCYDLSKKLAEEQRHLLSVESFGFMKKYLEQPIDFQLSDSCLIYVKEFQKKISADGNNLRAVEMICLEDGQKQANLNSNQNIKKYMKKCSQLCWMMMISDPPIYLNFDVTVGEKLDKNVYNVFTKSGIQIEFLVWPAMYLYKAGSLLVKGVAQGK